MTTVPNSPQSQVGPCVAEGVTVRFWAGARAAAGTESVVLPAGALSRVRADLVSWRPALEPVLAVSSLLADGLTVSDHDRLDAGSTLEVLPPFAGG